jgi:plastocyanin
VRRQLALLVALAFAPAAHADTVFVSAAGSTFTPGQVTIAVGDTVTWTADPGVYHTVTEGSNGSQNGTEAFHSDLYSGVPTFSVTFDEAFLAAHPRAGNVYDYFCVPHYPAAMVGQVIVDVPEAESFCAGDGFDGTDCPCNNNTAFLDNEGCRNSTGVGATLTASGSLSYATDDLVLKLRQAREFQPAVFLQGSTVVSFPFKDGKLCMGAPTERMEIGSLDSHGGLDSAQSIVTNGNVPGPGATRYYQAWYRDPVVSVCGSGSNFSAGLIIEWF